MGEVKLQCKNNQPVEHYVIYVPVVVDAIVALPGFGAKRKVYLTCKYGHTYEYEVEVED